MSTQPVIQAYLELSSANSDAEELDQLTRSLQTEILDLPVAEAKRPASKSTGSATSRTKGAEEIALGAVLVSLAPTVIPPLIELIKSWTARQPSVAVKVKLVNGDQQAEIEFDPAKMKPAEISKLVQSLEKTLTRK